MRILLIHRYFWPDTPPYASMLRAIARQLVADGHEVEVLTSQPSYKSDHSIPRQPSLESLDGFTIRRLALLPERGKHIILRLLNLLYFPVRIMMHCLTHKRFDAIMASTAPPVVTGLAAALAARLTNTRFVYHCMDIHPEIGRLSGEFRNPVLFRVLQKMDEWSCRHAARVIVLSDDMSAALRQRPEAGKQNILVINNFSLPTFDQISGQESVARKSPATCRILFAGNIGRFQGLEAFIDAMAHLSHRKDVELLFLGEGSALSGLKKRAAADTRIIFVPHQAINTAKTWMRSADLGIVSLSTGIYRYAFPSKTMTYLEEGLPLLTAVEQDSELARFVTDNRIGIVVTPNDPARMAAEIERLLDNPAHIALMRQEANKVAGESFSQQAVLPKWSALFRELAA